MTRLAVASALLFCCLSSATAAFTTQQAPSGGRTFPEQVRKEVAEPPRQAQAAAQPELAINQQTEILLNGRACRYEQVPANAVIRLLEVSTDRKTVLRIHFSTSK